MNKITSFLLLLVFGVSCTKVNEITDIIPDAPTNTPTPEFKNIPLTTDKSIYLPGDTIWFEMDISGIPANAIIRYKKLNTVLEEFPLTSPRWYYLAPADDFKGYLAEVVGKNNEIETIYATVGVDVSSSWTKFPRYGFLSSYPQMDPMSIESIIENLNKYHINGIQFYDWLNKHHMPLPVENNEAAQSWKDIMNRNTYFRTVEDYISSAHDRNMKAMFYNLIYGAWDKAELDGVKKEWYVYTDNTHTNMDFHPLSSPFLSNIYMLDPSNSEWQNYIKIQNRNVYNYLNFDGFHMDQLGDRGARYKYDGSNLNLGGTFEGFINSVKEDEPDKYIVMNAVNQYGQQGIAKAESDFLYTEVWSPFDTYNDLSNIIKQNNLMGNYTKNVVLAAYMNYDMANNPGYFNIPSVLMTDAVIFAFGGSHLELGEHMLGKEYFPNSNLAMKEDLKKSLIKYYDFLVAYQNLLRDGGTFNKVTLGSIDNKISYSAWPAAKGKVAVVAKDMGNKQIIHLINFTNSTTQNWRDNTGIQVLPGLIKDAATVLTTDKTIKNIWIASPDIAGGTDRQINFAQSGNNVSFTIPELRYWDMIVVEY